VGAVAEGHLPRQELVHLHPGRVRLQLDDRRLDAAQLRSVGTMELQVDATPTGALADYVSGSSGDGDVAVRVRCSRSGSFFTSGDLLRITYQR
jgi:hypothetical protein